MLNESVCFHTETNLKNKDYENNINDTFFLK